MMAEGQSWPLKNKKKILILKSLFIVLVPWLLLAFAKYDATFEWVPLESLHHSAGESLKSCWGFFYMVAIPAILACIVDLILAFAEESHEKLHSTILMYKRLVEHLNDIVAQKAKWFDQYKHKNNEDTFDVITKPEARIKTILENLCAFLKASLDKKIKIVLFEIKDGLVDSILEYVPADSAPTVNPSQYKNLFASNVAKSAKTLLVPDISIEIKKPARKRIYTPSGDSDCGSIIGYPIKGRGNIVKYVLTVKTDDSTISKKFDDGYSCVISYFLQRIRLEAVLHEIKVSSQRLEQ